MPRAFELRSRQCEPTRGPSHRLAIIGSRYRPAVLTRALIVMFGCGCWHGPAHEAAPARATVAFAALVPIGPGEQVLEAAPAWFELARGGLQIAAPEAVASGQPVEASISVLGLTGPIAVDVTLTGPGGPKHQRVTVAHQEEPFQGCDPVYSASECDRPPRMDSARVKFRTKLPEGEYLLTATIDGASMPSSHEVRVRVRIVSPRLATAYAVHPSAGAGAYRLRARAIVEKDVAGERMLVRRGVYEVDGKRAIVDISEPLTPTQVDVIGRQLRGASRTVRYSQVLVEPLANGGVASWISFEGAPPGRVAVWVSFPSLDDLTLVDRYVGISGPGADPTGGPAPPQPVHAPPLYNSGAICTADAQHCCRNDLLIVEPGGCQTSYPDDVQPRTVRGTDGYCVVVRCDRK